MRQDTKTRFSLSIAPELADALDVLVQQKGYPSRSQAVSEIIREHLVEHQSDHPHVEIVGTITLMYDHHKRNLTSALTDIQHGDHALIRSVLHVHVEHSLCMEVLAVCGPSGRVREMADRLITTKGIQHGRLTVTSITGKKGGRHHAHPDETASRCQSIRSPSKTNRASKPRPASISGIQSRSSDHMRP